MAFIVTVNCLNGGSDSQIKAFACVEDAEAYCETCENLTIETVIEAIEFDGKHGDVVFLVLSNNYFGTDVNGEIHAFTSQQLAAEKIQELTEEDDCLILRVHQVVLE
jgi:hypothetical protein